jgi:hypothetical protein
MPTFEKKNAGSRIIFMMFIIFHDFLMTLSELFTVHGTTLIIPLV